METSNEKTIEQWLEDTSEQFAVISESSLLDARVLLAHLLERPQGNVDSGILEPLRLTMKQTRSSCPLSKGTVGVS